MEEVLTAIYKRENEKLLKKGCPYKLIVELGVESIYVSISDFYGARYPRISDFLNDWEVLPIPVNAETHDESKIKGAEELFQLMDKRYPSYKITKAVGEVLIEYRNSINNL